jgi:hypothetical protein
MKHGRRKYPAGIALFRCNERVSPLPGSPKRNPRENIDKQREFFRSPSTHASGFPAELGWTRVFAPFLYLLCAGAQAADVPAAWQAAAAWRAGADLTPLLAIEQ